MRLSICIILLAVLAGCVGRSGETSYNDLVTRSVSSSWNTVEVQVRVPRYLTVSEANRFAPRADIVWRGDPSGDRHQQVKEIVTAAAQRASRYMRGYRPVRIEIELEQFHALSDRARLVAPFAVHNVKFKIRVFDKGSGRQIVPTDRIRADFPAYTGVEALEAERHGLTQKVRIIRHLEDVLKGWLRLGPDPRGAFSALDR